MLKLRRLVVTSPYLGEMDGVGEPFVVMDACSQIMCQLKAKIRALEVQ